MGKAVSSTIRGIALPTPGIERGTESNGTLLRAYPASLRPVDRHRTRWMSMMIRKNGGGVTVIASVVMRLLAIAMPTKKTLVNGPAVAVMAENEGVAKAAAAAARMTEQLPLAVVPASAAEIEIAEGVEVVETTIGVPTMGRVAPHKGTTPTTGMRVEAEEGEMALHMDLTATATLCLYAEQDEGMTNGLRGHPQAVETQVVETLWTGHWQSVWDSNVRLG